MGDRQQSERQGRGAETLAMIWLLLTGHRILAHRWRGRGGEIDIVAYRRRMIIFCEVKFQRRASESGIPTPRQRRRICRAAQEFASRRHLSGNVEWRFDLVQISPPLRGSVLPVRHLKDAWRCDG